MANDYGFFCCESMMEYFSDNRAVYSFVYHDKLRHVTIERVGKDKQGNGFIVARNVAIDGASPDKLYATYRFDKMSDVGKVS